MHYCYIAYIYTFIQISNTNSMLGIDYIYYYSIYSYLKWAFYTFRFYIFAILYAFLLPFVSF